MYIYIYIYIYAHVCACACACTGEFSTFLCPPWAQRRRLIDGRESNLGHFFGPAENPEPCPHPHSLPPSDRRFSSSRHPSRGTERRRWAYIFASRSAPRAGQQGKPRRLQPVSRPRFSKLRFLGSELPGDLLRLSLLRLSPTKNLPAKINYPYEDFLTPNFREIPFGPESSTPQDQDSAGVKPSEAWNLSSEISCGGPMVAR